MDRLRGSFVLEERGLIDVKGKGPMPTWFLDGRIAAGPATSAPSRRSGPAS
jgi:adenylate cyclase